MLLNLIFFNRYFDKNRLKSLILWSLSKSGEKTTIDLVEKLKDFGFYYATQAGLSLGVDDLKIPPTKYELILEAEVTLQSSQNEFEIGNLTIVEKFQQLIDVWHRTSEILKQNVVQHFRTTDILNPVYMMAFSGARGNISQVRQLVGMRGLMADPQGQILDFPIRSNFREGLTLTEYVISCYGARKGLVDTALRTANSGYLTRRLVDVAQHIIVRQLDCGTNNGIIITEMRDGKKTIFSLQKRLVGRILAESIENIAKRNQDISPALALKIVKIKNQVLVRSPLSCEAKNSICQLCYGWSLAHGSLVSLGEAVGILAAQSIGEPGTQLTMRTFHTGGVFSGDVMQEIRSPVDGVVKFSNPFQGLLIRTLHGKIAFLTKTDGTLFLYKQVEDLESLPSEPIKYKIPNSTVLFIREGEFVKEKQLLAEYSSVMVTTSQGIQANYNVNSPIEGQVYFEDVLLVIKSGKEGDLIKTALKFGSIWILAGKLYQSILRSNLFIKSGDLVDTNSLVTESIFITPYSGILDEGRKTIKKFRFFSKKPMTNSNQLGLLKTLISNQKTINPNKFIFPLPEKNQNIQNELNLNELFLQIHFEKIQYKKFGYFLTLENSNTEQLFLPISLNEKHRSLKELNFQWLRKVNFKKKGLVIIDSIFINKQRGQFFLMEENCYKISKENLFFISQLTDGEKISKTKKFIFLKNKQANIVSMSSNQNGFLTNYVKVKNDNIFYLKNFNKKTTLSLKKNPNIKQVKVKKSMKIILKNSSIPFHTKLNRIKIRKPNFAFEMFNVSKPSLQTHSEQLAKSETNFNKYKKTNLLKLEINDGWNFIAKNKSNLFVTTPKFLTPISQINTYHFDQNFVYRKTRSLNKEILFFFKSKRFTKIRYINNKLFRYNYLQFYTNEIGEFSDIKKDKKRDIKNFFIQTKFFISKTSNISNSILKRNKVFKINYKYKLFYFIEIKKLIEIQAVKQLQQKQLLYKISNNSRKFKFFDLQNFLFNKQKITKLKNPVASLDIKIQTFKLNIFQKNQLSIFNPKNIDFSFPYNYRVKKGNLNIEFGQNLNFLINRKIEPINYIFHHSRGKKISKSQLVFTQSNQILEQNPFTLNSFFSSSNGEITTVKNDVSGKEKSLILTANDKISFSRRKKPVCVKIGKLVRYGDEIIQNIAVPESGQIIQIDKNKITLRKAKPILFSSQGVFHVENGDIIEKNTPLITLFYQKLKTEDIVQGIPKIEELFEARQTKEGESLQENLHIKLNLFFLFYKQQYTPQQAARKSIEKIQQILVNNVQKVYQSQGVSIADKHIEIIVRQMTTKVKITESGRTGLLRGELIDLEWVEIINLGIEAQNKITNRGLEVEKAEYEPVILGITKAALETESFISASSFQETTRILSRAAIERKTDFLRGLKENVILGHLIPAGTGFTLSFDSKIKGGTNFNRLAWLSYKDIITNFSKNPN